MNLKRNTSGSSTICLINHFQITPEKLMTPVPETIALPIYRNTELGIEKRCTKCLSYFPFDNEFFYKNGFRDGKQQWSSLCKPCYVAEYRATRSRKK